MAKKQAAPSSVSAKDEAVGQLVSKLATPKVIAKRLIENVDQATIDKINEAAQKPGANQLIRELLSSKEETDQ